MQKQSVRLLQNVSHNRTSHKNQQDVVGIYDANPAPTITS